MKAETIIGLVVLIIFGLAVGLLYSVYSHDRLHNYNKSPVTIADEKESVSDNQDSNFTRLVPSGQNICEGCHLSGKKFIPQADTLKQHANGGAYCLECHKIDHKIHPMTPANPNVTCERCHGTRTPQVPEFRNGTIVCAECHDYPDPLIPSKGNLITIHRPRNVDCAKCHIGKSGSCLECHNEIKSDDKWEKRLAHFRTIVRTLG